MVAGSNPARRASYFFMLKFDEIYMREALKEAKIAFDEDEVPVGAIIVYKNRIIGRAHNQIKLLKDPTAHAEMIAITQAASCIENERLPGSTLYVTIEPCMMCAGALVLARIERVCFGAFDPKTGAFGSVIDINKLKLNHNILVTKGVLEKDCIFIMQEFFRKKRK